MAVDHHRVDTARGWRAAGESQVVDLLEGTRPGHLSRDHEAGLKGRQHLLDRQAAYGEGDTWCDSREHQLPIVSADIDRHLATGHELRFQTFEHAGPFRRHPGRHARLHAVGDVVQRDGVAVVAADEVAKRDPVDLG